MPKKNKNKKEIYNLEKVILPGLVENTRDPFNISTKPNKRQ